MRYLAGLGVYAVPATGGGVVGAANVPNTLTTVSVPPDEYVELFDSTPLESKASLTTLFWMAVTTCAGSVAGPDSAAV